MKTICSLLVSLAVIVAHSAGAQTAQLIVTAPSELAGSYAAVTYDAPPSNVTLPIGQGNIFVYDGVNCSTHTLTKPVAGSGAGKVALLTGNYPSSCNDYDQIVRELQADGVVAVVFGFTNGVWRTALRHVKPTGLTVPVLDMQVDEVAQSIRSAVVGGTMVAVSFVAVRGMVMKEVANTVSAGGSTTFTMPALATPSTGATFDFASVDLDRTVAGLQNSYTLDAASCGGGVSFVYDPLTHVVKAKVPPGNTYTGICTTTFLIRDTAGFQGIGRLALYIGVPFALDDQAQVGSGGTVSIDVLANDLGDPSIKVPARIDLNPSSPSVNQSVTVPEGVWRVVGNNVEFASTAGFVGVVSIGYVVRGASGGSSNEATISVNVGTPALDLNQHGLTGSWYEPVTSGQGFVVEVYPDLAAAGTGLVFVSWFTYDTIVGGPERQRWYTLSGPVASGQPASLIIYQNTGGNFNAAPITAANPVGTATLSFDSCVSGHLSYHFTDGSGRAGDIPLTRITKNETCSTTGARPTNADFALSGNWYDPATSGQGLTVEVNPDSNVLFFAWYTYAPNGAYAGAAGQRWYTAQGAFAPGTRSVPVTIYETTGGSFDSITDPAPRTVEVGAGTVTFQSCSSATLSFGFTGGSSSGAAATIALKRVGPVPYGGAGCWDY